MESKGSRLSALNRQLLADNCALALEEYIREAQAFLGVQVDGGFARELAPLLDRDELVVPHSLLIKFKVINVANSARIKDLLEQYALVEGRDFRVETMKIQHPSGGRPAKRYYLHPDAFELALIRAKNTKAYAAHYIFLRRCVAGYREYQAQLRERQLAGELEALRAEKRRGVLELARLRAEAPPPRHATFLHRREEPPLAVGCLYFIEAAEAGLTKIGFTHRLPARLRSLQAGSPHPLAVYRAVHCVGPAAYEALAHAHFAAARRRGEWFAVDRAAVDAFVAGLEL